MRELKIEDSPNPSLPSSYYTRHLDFFGISPEGKSIRQIVLELKTTVTEIFVRNCHFQPDTYHFTDLRLTRTYKLHRELCLYLQQLSSWLYRDSTFPPGLKKVFAKGNSFKNPYQDFSLGNISEKDLENLDNLMLSVAFNKDICSESPDRRFQKLVLREFKKRQLDTSTVEKTKNILIEVVQKNNKPVLCLLQENVL